MKETNIAQLKNTCIDLKKHVIEMVYKAQSGHPGGSAGTISTASR